MKIDVYNLDISLAKIIAKSLRKYIKRINSYPNAYSHIENEQEAMACWKEDLEKMHLAFSRIAKSSKKIEGVQEGLDLFAKHFRSLWI